ncbi:MAG: hypothetical protein FJ304_00940 [Planctomycetes bacterium]|nr:hypothetical protein [Planctomycetota bacterium]
MSRFRFGAGCALLLAFAALASAQPGKPPGVIQFKQFGATPDQFWQSSLTRWTGQLALDLETIKADVARANLAAVNRAAVNVQIENSILQNAELDQIIRRGQKDKAFAAFADVEKALTGLHLVLSQNPTARVAAAGALSRADTAYQQLAAALGTGDNDPARLKRRLIRLTEAIDDNAEELRSLLNDLTAHDRNLDRTLALYAREPRLMARRVRDDADADLIKRTYEAMVARWADATALLGRARQLPQAVLAQAQKVDGLHRRLGTVLNLPAYPNNGNPPPLLPPAGKHLAFAVGAGDGGAPRVTVFASEKGDVAYTFFAYDKNFDCGARVDMADLNGDGVPDLIVAPGPSRTVGGLPVRVYDGRDRNLLVEFVPFAAWKGGLHVAGLDLMRDGRSVIAVNAEGTQHIKVFDLAQGKEIDSFFAHDQKVPGGVRIAWGDVNGDGLPDLITANGPSNVTTTVKVFSGKNRDVLAEFPAVDAKYRGGAFVAAADLTGNGRANPVVGLDAGTVPLARVFDDKGKVLAEWLAFDERFRGGVRVAVSANNNVVAGPGPGAKNSPVRLFHTGRLKNPPIEIVPFVGFDGGVNVGGR